MGALDVAGRQRPALLAIVIVVAGAVWGVVEVTGEAGFYGSHSTVLSKLLPTVIAAALFSAVIGSGVRLAERQKELAPIGWLTVLIGLVAFAAAARLAFKGNFLEGEGDDLAESMWFIALAAGQVSLLLSWPRRGDRGPAMATAVLAALATIGLAIACVVEISKNGSQVSADLFGVLMVAYLLGLVLVPLATLAFPSGGGAALPNRDGLALDHASLLAEDPGALARFYSTLLGEQATPRGDGSGAFGVGHQLTVWGLDAPAAGPGGAGRTGPAGLSFAWPGTPESAVEMLQVIGATSVSGPVETRGARGAAASVSGRDPEGNSLELVCYRMPRPAR